MVANGTAKSNAINKGNLSSIFSTAIEIAIPQKQKKEQIPNFLTSSAGGNDIPGYKPAA